MPGEENCAMTDYHHECAVRAIAGSVGHQNRTCACYQVFDSSATPNHDPPAMTKREAARAAYDLYLRKASN